MTDKNTAPLGCRPQKDLAMMATLLKEAELKQTPEHSLYGWAHSPADSVAVING